jgi:hypothetical protein
MYERFTELFPPDTGGEKDRLTSPVLRAGIGEFLSAFGGMSFRNSIYRIVKPAEEATWKERVAGPYPEFRARVTCFGFDWMGNVFATDSSRLIEGQDGVVMFEPGTGKALNIPSNLETFHEKGLHEFGEAVLAISFYTAWTKAGGAAPNYSQCIGYKKPLFLGGADTVDNLEISDIDVYWHILGQMIRKTRGLPPGTPVRSKIS